jgi:lipoprotein-anchoring transpeptidase ErfK/SrfK
VDVRTLRRAVLGRLVALRAWVTWSPRRARTVAGVCLAVLVVSPLAAGIARTVSGGGSSGATEVPAASTSPAPPAQAQPGDGAPVVTASPSGPNDSDAEVSQADQEAASTVAQRFASLWLAGAFVADRQRWADSLSDLVDPSLNPFLVATPASAIPRTSVASAVPQLVAPTYGAVRVTFADGTGMDLQMSATGSSWRVVQYLPTTTP